MEVEVTQPDTPLKTRLEWMRKADRQGMFIPELPVVYNAFSTIIMYDLYFVTSAGNNEMVFSPPLTNYLLLQFITELHNFCYMHTVQAAQ